MKLILIPAIALSLSFGTVAAETQDEGIDLMEEGAKLFLRGLLNEVEPAIDELQGLAEEFGPRLQVFTEQMGPAFAELFEQVDDLRNYEPPVFLPNGDIIMRRRDGAPDFAPALPEDIEL